MNSPSLQTGQRQQHTVTPRLQHAVRLLQLSSLDFAQEVHDAMGKNPFLEVEDGPVDPTQPVEATNPDSAPAEGVEAVAEFESEMPYDREPWAHGSSGTRANGTESEIGALDLVAADEGLRPHLHRQINVLPLSMRDHTLACTVIESLDDDGYLRTDLEELARLPDLDPPVEISEMQVALKLVQSLDPCGVGARSVCECLQLQLECIEDETQRDLARRIVTNHLDRLAQHDVNALAKSLASTPAQIEAVCERIRHLDPRPGWRHGAPDTHYVTPDVIVRKVRGKWVATLNRAVIPRVRLNHAYASMFQEHRESRHSELAAHLQEARWTVRNVQQRFSSSARWP
jgi:RNA polymerase sigma-54 factor